jgi:uncharacterized protein (TIGR02145 family)
MKTMRYLLTSLLCVFTLSFSAQEACPNVFDYDNDGNIAINDFIAMLSYFGDTDSDSDGVFDSEDDCIDETACNYQANPTESCYYLDVLGVCNGWCIEDADGDGVCDWNCGENLIYGGYGYSTIQIGNQCWFAENCRYLPSVSPTSASSFTSPYYYVNGYEGTDVAEAQATANYDTYGVYYNWPAVMTEGICPSGWHIPSDGEWQTMEISLGMSESEAAIENSWRGTDEGYQMKSASGWLDAQGYFGNGSNSSGFNGLPGGHFSSSTGFSDLGYSGYWWTSSESDSSFPYPWKRQLMFAQDGVYRNNNFQNTAFSARCVRDD